MFKYFCIALFLNLLFACIKIHTLKVPVQPKEKWRLIWSDEFDYEGFPDKNKWDYDIGGWGWGNNEQQFYTAYDFDTARVTKGILIIEAHKKKHKGMDYKSARITTKGKFDFLYGKVEVRAKLPKGRGLWPAIWMLPKEEKYGAWPSSGEIDIVEMVGYEENYIYFSIHTHLFNHKIGTQKTYKTYLPKATEYFHTYGIEWYPYKIDFFLNGVKLYTFNKLSDDWKYWPFNERFYLIINLAVGGSWGGAKGIDNSIFPQKMEIDYVRIYQLVY